MAVTLYNYLSRLTYVHRIASIYFMTIKGNGKNVRMLQEDYQAAQEEIEKRGDRTTIGDIIHEWRLAALAMRNE